MRVNSHSMTIPIIMAKNISVKTFFSKYKIYGIPINNNGNKGFSEINHLFMIHIGSNFNFIVNTQIFIITVIAFAVTRDVAIPKTPYLVPKYRQQNVIIAAKILSSKPSFTKPRLLKKQSTNLLSTLKITKTDIIRNAGTSSSHSFPKNIVIINSALKKKIAKRTIAKELSKAMAFKNTSCTLLMSFCMSESIGNSTVSNIPFILFIMFPTKPAGRLYAPKTTTDVHFVKKIRSICCVMLLVITLSVNQLPYDTIPRTSCLCIFRFGSFIFRVYNSALNNKRFIIEMETIDHNPICLNRRPFKRMFLPTLDEHAKKIFIDITLMGSKI